jgi:hypothetical protein
MIPSSMNPESECHTSVQVLFLGIVNCVDAEQMWWCIRDGILKKTGIGMTSYEARDYITLERRRIFNLCRIIVKKNRFGFSSRVDYVHVGRAIIALRKLNVVTSLCTSL